MKLRGVLAVCLALTLAGSAAPALAQQIKVDNKQPKRSKQEQADIEALVKMVDAASAGQTAPSDVPITWVMNDFIKAQGGATYVPFVVNIDRSKVTKPNVWVYLRAVDKNAPPPAAAPAPAADAKDSKDKDKNKQAAAPPMVQYAWNGVNAVDIPQDGLLPRAVQLAPGEYDLFIAVKEKSVDEKTPATKAGVLRHTLTVPDYNKPDLQVSTVLLAKGIEPLQAPMKPEEQQESPFTLGQLKVVRSYDHKFAKDGMLNLIYFIYGAKDIGGGKPNVQVEYTFYQKADTSKPYKKFAPRMKDAMTLPPEFNLTQHQLEDDLVDFSLAGYPPGEYRLEIKVTDKGPGGQSLTQNVEFTIS
jgi:hypothetical protein